MAHDFRVIPLDGRPHLPPSVRQWKGDPRGHWEGTTLVVDTTNFAYSDKSRFGNIYDGFTDQNLHVTERFTRTGPKTIIYRATVDDPTIYTKPWTIETSSSKSEEPIYELRLPRRQLRHVWDSFGRAGAGKDGGHQVRIEVNKRRSHSRVGEDGIRLMVEGL